MVYGICKVEKKTGRRRSCQCESGVPSGLLLCPPQGFSCLVLGLRVSGFRGFGFWGFRVFGLGVFKVFWVLGPKGFQGLKTVCRFWGVGFPDFCEVLGLGVGVGGGGGGGGWKGDASARAGEAALRAGRQGPDRSPKRPRSDVGEVRRLQNPKPWNPNPKP